MRIIGGRHGRRVLRVPPGLPVRPTTDFAKEGLFNVLNNLVDFANIKVLDLFAGTGHIAFEFSSRGAQRVTAVDENQRCISFIRQTAAMLSLEIDPVKNDVFEFLKSVTGSFDVIFADPPYDLENIEMIHQLVFSRNLLSGGGILIIEHGARTHLENLSFFTRHRKYGNVHFTFFVSPEDAQRQE